GVRNAHGFTEHDSRRRSRPPRGAERAARRTAIALSAAVQRARRAIGATAKHEQLLEPAVEQVARHRAVRQRLDTNGDSMSTAGLSSYRSMTAYGGLADASPHQVI